MMESGGGGIAGLGSTLASSGDLTYALSSSVSYSFASNPKLYWVTMRCTVADNGFSVGDELMLGMDGNYDGVNQYGLSIFRTGSTVKVSNRLNIWCATPTGAGAAALTAGRWAIVINAIL